MVLSFTLQKDQLSGDEFLIIEHLPRKIYRRYGSIPSRVYIRRCYKQLYDITADKMASGSMETGVTLYTGVPGIGKSLFLIYFIYRFLHDDRFPDKRFALEFERKEYFLFEPTLEADDVFTCSCRDATSIDDDDDFLVLCDIQQPEEPAGRAKWTLIFSSPDRARYKEITKNAPSFRYTLPTWSEQELTSCDNRKQLWYDNFVHFGGVPRHVLPKRNATDDDLQPLQLLESMAGEKGGLIVTEFFKFGFSTLDLIQNYLLIHINPPPPISPSSSGNDFQYNGLPEYSFASDHVFQLLVAKHEAMMLAQAADVFNVGAAASTYGSASAGHLFEKICLWLKPLEGNRFTAAALGSAGGPLKRFEVPSSRELLPHDWKEAPLLRPNIHYLPRISNLESGDSFYLVETTAEEYLLVVFQFTVAAKEHKVKSNGLSVIVKAFQESLVCNITQKALVFVIPQHGSMATVQAIVTQKGHAITQNNMPLTVRGFQQYVYRRTV